MVHPAHANNCVSFRAGARNLWSFVVKSGRLARMLRQVRVELTPVTLALPSLP
jgi:hypothetical protein